MWKYQISTGEITNPAGKNLGKGYSGKAGIWRNNKAGIWRNNPDAEPEAAAGPIPEGYWHIGPAHTSPNTGPITMDLEPASAAMNVYGRSLFRIHGDNNTHDASHGCIILDRPIREQIAASPDHLLEVTR